MVFATVELLSELTSELVGVDNPCDALNDVDNVVGNEDKECVLGSVKGLISGLSIRLAVGGALLLSISISVCVCLASCV